MKGWKTIILAILIAIVGAVEALSAENIIPANIVGYILMAIGVVQAILRSVTTTPIGKKVNPNDL